ncbi:hypothetical protein ES705_34934 [subsurface metagenome]
MFAFPKPKIPDFCLSGDSSDFDHCFTFNSLIILEDHESCLIYRGLSEVTDKKNLSMNNLLHCKMDFRFRKDLGC